MSKNGIVINAMVKDNTIFEDYIMNEGREVWRTGHKATQCHFVTKWKAASDVPKYVHAYDIERDQNFIAEQRMGAWMEVDIQDLVWTLNSRTDIKIKKYNNWAS